MINERDRGMENPAKARTRDAADCPALSGNTLQRAQRADQDACDFAMAVREEDPAVVWGRVARWAERHPQRLMATFVHLAAMVDVDGRIAPWTRDLGGTAALHPDYATSPASRPAPTPRPGVSAYREAVHELVNTTALSDAQIATRLGCARKTVARYRLELGVLRPTGRRHAIPDVDERVAEMDARGMKNAEIVAATGLSLTTIKVARRRRRAAAEDSVTAA